MNGDTAYDYFELTKKLSRQTLDLVTAETVEQFDEAFDRWMEQAIAKLETNKKNYLTLPENGLSAVLASTLSTGEVSVTQEENSNGHVDLTIKLVNASSHMVKLGEAKIWDGPKYHAKGVGQLLNRYTTGRECRGFVISYVRDKDILGLFKKLRGYLDENKPFDLNGICMDHSIRWSFLSTHNHSSGELVEVCHVGCNLYHG